MEGDAVFDARHKEVAGVPAAHLVVMLEDDFAEERIVAGSLVQHQVDGDLRRCHQDTNVGSDAAHALQ